MNIPDKVLDEVQAAMEQWTDGRVIEAASLEAMLLFHLYVPNVLSQIGQRVDGYVFRQKNGQTLLTVKAKENGTPLVVFITSNTPTGCMERFLNLLEDDRLTWRKDRYPWI